MKSIILIAAPAAGKGTEATLLKNQYNIPHISTGELLRAARNDGSERAKIICEHQDKGALVPFDIVLELLKERIMQHDCDNGYILDGFPRDVKQAEAYDKILKEVNREIGAVIVLDIDKEVAKVRISGRRSCHSCGKVYNINNEALKPKKDGYCDNCSIELTHRSDDNPDTYEQRYDSYLKHTEPLIEYYQSRGIVYHVDASGDKDETHKQVVEILGE